MFYGGKCAACKILYVFMYECINKWCFGHSMPLCVCVCVRLYSSRDFGLIFLNTPGVNPRPHTPAIACTHVHTLTCPYYLSPIIECCPENQCFDLNHRWSTHHKSCCPANCMSNPNYVTRPNFQMMCESIDARFDWFIYFLYIFGFATIPKPWKEEKPKNAPPLAHIHIYRNGCDSMRQGGGYQLVLNTTPNQISHVKNVPVAQPAWLPGPRHEFTSESAFLKWYSWSDPPWQGVHFTVVTWHEISVLFCSSVKRWG